MTDKPVKWLGSQVCEICDADRPDTLYDAKTIAGSWALLCERCYNKFGLGLGLGRGQKYQRQPDGSYLKVAG